MNTAVKGLVPLIIVLVLVLVLLGGMTVVVNAGHVGVVRRLGAVQENALSEGFHWKMPFVDQVDQLDIRLNASNAQATAASRDLQIVSTEVTTQYSLNGAMAPQTYQRIGNLSKVAAALVEPGIQECVKAVTARFTAEELVTKREAVKVEIQKSLENFINSTLAEKDLQGAVNIANLAITDFNFSEEFNLAIEAKVKAEQESLQAINEKKRRTTQAEAAASEVKLAAEAKAFSTEIQSKARADAIEREAEALQNSPELIQLRAVERWDGALPRMNGGNGVVPFINMGDFEPRGEAN